MILDTFIATINELSGGNDMIAGALTLAASAMVSGAVGVIFYRFPQIVITFFKAQFTTSLTIIDNGNEEGLARKLSLFLNTHATEIGSRFLALESGWDRDKEEYIHSIVVGYGLHILYYQGRFLFVRKELINEVAIKVQTRIIITTIGRSHVPLRSMVEDLLPDKKENYTPIYRYNIAGSYWDLIGKNTPTPLDNLALNRGSIDAVLDELTAFASKKDIYDKLGLPHKITYLLYGKPGSGKTSLVRALAAEINFGIYTIQMNGIKDDSFLEAIRKMPPNSILLMEDVDAIHASRNEDDEFHSLSLSGLLNAFDGIAPLAECIVIMTTNHIDRLDPALKRTGRVDRKIKLPPLDPSTVQKHFERLYPGISVDTYPTLSGCEINGIIFEAKECKQTAAALLNVSNH